MIRRGVMAPYLGQLKVLNQELWNEEAIWDAPIPEEVQEKWTREIAELSKLPQLEFPRHFRLDEMQKETTKLDRVTSCDASSKLYAACVYLRVITEEEVIVSLAACSKGGA